MNNLVGPATVTFLLVIGQVLFKKLGLSIRDVPVAEGLVAMMRQPLFYLALLIYGIATMLWIWVLSRVPLSQAYPWVAVGIVFVALLGWWIYGERPTPVFWLGVGLVALGVLCTQYGSQSS